MIKYYDKPINITLIMNDDITNQHTKYLPNVIATDFDNNHYRFYLQDYNPINIGDTDTKINKPDGQLGTLGLPYTFKKNYIKDILSNGNSIL